MQASDPNGASSHGESSPTRTRCVALHGGSHVHVLLENQSAVRERASIRIIT